MIPLGLSVSHWMTSRQGTPAHVDSDQQSKAAYALKHQQRKHPGEHPVTNFHPTNL